MGYLKIFVVLLSIHVSLQKASFKIVLERCAITMKDPVHIGGSNCTVSKFNRTSPYVMNVYADILKKLDEAVKVEVKTYEFHNNQFKESFIRADTKFCATIKTNQWIVPGIRKYSNLPKACPFKPGPFIITNYVLSEETLPSGLPEGTWQFDFNFCVSKKCFVKFQVVFKIEKIVARKGNKKQKSNH